MFSRANENLFSSINIILGATSSAQRDKVLLQNVAAYLENISREVCHGFIHGQVDLPEYKQSDYDSSVFT